VIQRNPTSAKLLALNANQQMPSTGVNKRIKRNPKDDKFNGIEKRRV